MPDRFSKVQSNMTDQHNESEERIIQDYLEPLSRGYAGAFGLKDDCAIVTPPPGADLVVTTDPIREDVHFFTDDAPAHIAWKALAVNVSDLAAKAARPLAYVMALSLPKFPESDWLRAFADGLSEAQEAFGMHLIGGDTDRADGPLTVATTVFGTVPAGQMVRRGTAHPGDLLYLSGSLGNSTFGLQLRRDPGLAGRWGLSSEDASVLLAHYLAPQPRLALRMALRDYAHAAMDLSDGLVKDAARMCKASNVGAVLNIADVPTSAAVAKILLKDPDQRVQVITGGDDYEILSAVPPGEARDFEAEARDAGVRITQIGHVKDGDCVEIIDSNGAHLDLPRTGWDHF